MLRTMCFNALKSHKDSTQGGEEDTNTPPRRKEVTKRAYTLSMNHGITQRGGSSDRSSVRIRASPAAQTGRRHKPRFWLLWLAQAIKSIPPIQSEHMQPRPHHRLVLVLLLCSVVLRRRHHCRRSYPRHEPRSRSLARARARVCWFLSIDRSFFVFCFAFSQSLQPCVVSCQEDLKHLGQYNYCRNQCLKI
jgi:hypothetical protein